MAEQFLRFLLKNENTRKIFGKRELKIIEKQLWGINLTQSEKNRLSRDIRKKLDFIKEISKYSDDFSLKKSDIVNENIEYIKNEILNCKHHSDIKRIYLFGSTITNERSFRSDIDLAVEFDKIDEKEAGKFRISMNADEKIDVQVLNFLPDKIKKEIIDNGKIIYERKN